MDGSLNHKQWKPADTARNGMVSQREIAAICVLQFHALEAYVLERCTFTGSLNECLRHDGRDDHEIAKAIHISRGYMSKLLRSVWALQIKRLIAFCRETRCIAPLQWAANELGYELRRKRGMASDRAAALAAYMGPERRCA